jgi:hypothetical protein
MAVEKKRTVRSRLIGIGAILLFFACAAFTSAGVMIAFGHSPRPRIMGWPILMLSIGLGVWAMKYWARTLPGILGCATLNGLIIISSGHALNQPAVPVDRLTATLVTLAVGLSAFLATTFRNRSLTIVDRIACLGILASFAMVFQPLSQVQFLGLAGIVACVIIAWAVARRHHVHHTASGTA